MTPTELAAIYFPENGKLVRSPKCYDIATAVKIQTVEKTEEVRKNRFDQANTYENK